MLSSRFKYFLWHFSCSFLFAIVFFAFILLVWYPAPLAKGLNIAPILWMLLIINIIIGFFLVFIVYKENKKSLKFDLSVIVVSQILAFIYGAFNIFQSRPVWLVSYGHQFELVRSNDVVNDKIALADFEYQSKPLWGPKFVSIKTAKSSKEHNQYLFDEVDKGLLIAYHPERFQSIEAGKVDLEQKQLDLNQLKNFNETDNVTTILSKFPEANGWVPLRTSKIDMVILIDKQGSVIKIVDLRPWN